MLHSHAVAQGLIVFAIVCDTLLCFNVVTGPWAWLLLVLSSASFIALIAYQVHTRPPPALIPEYHNNPQTWP